MDPELTDLLADLGIDSLDTILENSGRVGGYGSLEPLISIPDAMLGFDFGSGLTPEERLAAILYYEALQDLLNQTKAAMHSEAQARALRDLSEDRDNDKFRSVTEQMARIIDDAFGPIELRLDGILQGLRASRLLYGELGETNSTPVFGSVAPGEIWSVGLLESESDPTAAAFFPGPTGLVGLGTSGIGDTTGGLFLRHNTDRDGQSSLGSAPDFGHRGDLLGDLMDHGHENPSDGPSSGRGNPSGGGGIGGQGGGGGWNDAGIGGSGGGAGRTGSGDSGRTLGNGHSSGGPDSGQTGRQSGPTVGRASDHQPPGPGVTGHHPDGGGSNYRPDPTMPMSPVLLDLDGDGIEITELPDSTRFVVDDTGREQRMAWVSGGDGVLFIDADGNGAISNRHEFAFTEWAGGAVDDLDGLRRAFDSNGDGKLTAADARWQEFRVEVTHSDGTTSVMTLAELGITEINLRADLTDIRLSDGSAITGQATFVMGGVSRMVANATLAAEAAGYTSHHIPTSALGENAAVDLVRTVGALSNGVSAREACLDASTRIGEDRKGRSMTKIGLIAGGNGYADRLS